MKHWYNSRTIWLNIISILLEVGNMVMTNPIIPEKYAGILTMVVNLLNIALRTLTNTGIKTGKKKKTTPKPSAPKDADIVNNG